MSKKTDDILVSVIIPVCNVERFLAECLDSVLDQKHENLEVICLNDGSTDGSLEILRAYEAKDPRITVIDKPNEGYGATCNRGLKMASGEWVSIVEPDDSLLREMYRDMLEVAVSVHGPVDIVKTPWYDVRNWDQVRYIYKEPSWLYHRIATSRRTFTLKEHPELIATHPAIWSAIYRTEFLRERGIEFIPYPGAGWADNPFLIETMVQAKGIAYLDKPYYHYRCDLVDSTVGHKTADAVARPFDRWIDMLAVMDRLGVTDLGIIRAHYLRGFNYIAGAIYDDGWDNPIVQEKTREVFSLMDEQVVRQHPDIHPNRKAFFYDVLGLERPRLSGAPYGARLVREAFHDVHAHGLGHAFGRVLGHNPKAEPIADRHGAAGHKDKDE